MVVAPYVARRMAFVFRHWREACAWGWEVGAGAYGIRAYLHAASVWMDGRMALALAVYDTLSSLPSTFNLVALHCSGVCMQLSGPGSALPVAEPPAALQHERAALDERLHLGTCRREFQESWCGVFFAILLQFEGLLEAQIGTYVQEGNPSILAGPQLHPKPPHAAAIPSSMGRSHPFVVIALQRWCRTRAAAGCSHSTCTRCVMAPQQHSNYMPCTTSRATPSHA